MDIDLILIFGFILTFMLVVLTFGTIAGQRNREHKLQKLELQARIEEAKAQQARSEFQVTEDLEERMRVLERIVTDPSADLSRQIDNLRAQQAAEEEKVS